jgi:hypothetical protein
MNIFYSRIHEKAIINLTYLQGEGNDSNICWKRVPCVVFICGECHGEEIFIQNKIPTHRVL